MEIIKGKPKTKLEKIVNKILKNHQDMLGREARIEKLHPQDPTSDTCYILLEGGKDKSSVLEIKEGEIELIYDACREYLQKHIWD